MPSALFRFALLSVGRYDAMRRVSRACMLASITFAWSALFSNRLIDGVIPYPWGYYPAYGELGILLVAFFTLLYGVSLWLFWSAFRRLPKGMPQFRLKTIFLAFCIGGLGMIDFLPCYHMAAYPVGFLPAYACVLLLAQIIWQHGFPDITPAFAVSHILDTMPSALFVVDQDGVIRIANTMACDLFGQPESELLGSHLSGPLRGFDLERQM